MHVCDVAMELFREKHDERSARHTLEYIVNHRFVLSPLKIRRAWTEALEFENRMRFRGAISAALKSSDRYITNAHNGSLIFRAITLYYEELFNSQKCETTDNFQGKKENCAI
jgi:hypothetical protein